MSKIISQNELDAKQISDSVKNFFDRFHISRLLKTSNVKKDKGESPVSIMTYAFSLVFRNRSMYMDMLLGNSGVSFSKDTYYRFMNNVHANWIRFTSRYLIVNFYCIIKVRTQFYNCEVSDN